MGSVDKAVITGFICRLCSRMNRFVVHIYGEEGQRLQLAHKINFYLPINVNPYDLLPKTVCLTCIQSLEAQHKLMEQVKEARRRFVQAELNHQSSSSSESKDQPQEQLSSDEQSVEHQAPDEQSSEEQAPDEQSLVRQLSAETQSQPVLVESHHRETESGSPE